MNAGPAGLAALVALARDVARQEVRSLGRQCAVHVVESDDPAVLVAYAFGPGPAGVDVTIRHREVAAGLELSYTYLGAEHTVVVNPSNYEEVELFDFFQTENTAAYTHEMKTRPDLIRLGARP